MKSALQLRPLGDLLGTEALGVDLAKPLDEGIVSWIGSAFAEHPVLVFRDQNLGAAELAAFGRRFGVPREHALIKYRHAECPQVSWLTNVEDDGKVDWYGVKRATEWHTDSTYEDDPPILAILHAKEVPSAKGGTMFADMRAASGSPEVVPEGTAVTCVDGPYVIGSCNVEHIVNLKDGAFHLRCAGELLCADAADNRTGDLAEHRSDLELLALRGLRSSMTQRNVRQLVCHHARNFGFRLRRFDHSPIEEHGAARKSEGVDLFLVHHIEGVPEFRMLELWWNGRGERLANPLDVVLETLVVEHRQLFNCLGSRFLTELHIVLNGVVVFRSLDFRLCPDGKRQHTGDTEPRPETPARLQHVRQRQEQQQRRQDQPKDSCRKRRDSLCVPGFQVQPYKRQD